MDKIKKYCLLGGEALVTLIDLTETVNTAKKLHSLTDLSAVLLGQALVMTSYLGAGLKNDTDELSVIIDGGGESGKIICGATKGTVRGFIENPSLYPVLKSFTKEECAGVIGNSGIITTIMDLGLKTPFTGASEMLTGDLGLDFSAYLLNSEQKRTAVSLSRSLDGRFGGIILECLPFCSEETIVMVEDTADLVKDFDKIFKEKNVDEIAEFYFEFFEKAGLQEQSIEFKCKCSRKLTDKVIFNLGYPEAKKFVTEDGQIEICCSYCSGKQIYTPEDIDNLFEIK